MPTRLLRSLLPGLLLLAPLLSGCDALMGKEIARLPVGTISTPGHEVVKEASVSLPANAEVGLWSEMDMSYTEPARLEFQVQVLRDGQPFQQLSFDPREKNISLKEVKTNVNGAVKWSFTGKSASLRTGPAGRYTFRARLLADAPALQLRKAEVVVRQ